jgi:hypothetical protein
VERLSRASHASCLSLWLHAISLPKGLSRKLGALRQSRGRSDSDGVRWMTRVSATRRCPECRGEQGIWGHCDHRPIACGVLRTTDTKRNLAAHHQIGPRRPRRGLSRGPAGARRAHLSAHQRGDREGRSRETGRLLLPKSPGAAPEVLPKALSAARTRLHRLAPSSSLKGKRLAGV